MNSTVKAPAYSVNAEQFALRIYDKVSPIDGYSPAAGTVTATSRATLTFSVDTVLAASDPDARAEQRGGSARIRFPRKRR